MHPREPIIGVATATTLVFLLWRSGGYFPSAWGMLIVLFGSICAVAFVVLADARLHPRDVLLVASLVAFAGWAALSALWSTADGAAVAEGERDLLLAVALAALLLVVRARDVAAVAAGIVAGGTIGSVYGLGTRLYPGDVGGAYNPSNGYRLAEPIGYWNALGVLMALAAVLACALGRHDRYVIRGAAGAALVPIAAALYFTFSRGAVLALVVGMVVWLALEHARSRAFAELCALAIAPTIGVWLCSQQSALTAPGAPLQTAQAQGHRLAWLLCALAVAGGIVGAMVPELHRRLARVRTSRRHIGAVVGVAALVVIATLAIVLLGDRPASGAASRDLVTDGDLNGRLTTFGDHGRLNYWHVAARMATRSPLLGDGAATFERNWLRERPVAAYARDAHSLYLETVGELGLVGLGVLLVALTVPLTVVARARSVPFGDGSLAPALAGAYALFLAHAAIDWDWEIPAVTLPALACGACLVVLARSGSGVRFAVTVRAGLALASGLVVLAGLEIYVGNGATAAAANALRHGELSTARREAMRARSWTPWSAEPWRLLGSADLSLDDERAARRSLEEAVARDPNDWANWHALAAVPGSGRVARARAAALNPLGPG